MHCAHCSPADHPVPRDAHDARGPHVELGLVHRRDLEEVEGGGVQEVEGDEGEDPHQLVHAWWEGRKEGCMDINQEEEEEEEQGGGVSE